MPGHERVGQRGRGDDAGEQDHAERSGKVSAIANSTLNRISQFSVQPRTRMGRFLAVLVRPGHEEQRGEEALDAEGEMRDLAGEQEQRQHHQAGKQPVQRYQAHQAAAQEAVAFAGAAELAAAGIEGREAADDEENVDPVHLRERPIGCGMWNSSAASCKAWP